MDESWENLAQRLVKARDAMLTALPEISLPRYPKGVLRFPKVGASTTLCPLMEKEWSTAKKEDPDQPSKVFIVGYDGGYMKVGDATWKQKLSAWASEPQAEFTYLLLSPSDAALEEIKLLKKLDTKGVLDFRRLTPKVPDHVQDLVAGWKTTHFVMAENPKFLWIEGNHPVGKAEAENCAFFDHLLCNETLDWEISKHAADLVRPHTLSI